MNQALTEQIVQHILANLGVVPTSYMSEKTSSIIDKQFLLPEKVSFEVEDDVVQKNVYGCQISITDTKEFKMLLAECGTSELPEYCLLIQLKEAPTFGVSFLYGQLVEPPLDSEAMIAVSPDHKNWMPCNTYLQATFLAGMEQLRDLGFGWTKCANYQEQYQQLLSFIRFRGNYFGGFDEGQED
jgi:hypothetical protein